VAPGHAVRCRGLPAHAQSGSGLEVYGQELNEETYAICRSDMMLKGQEASNIAVGNSLSEDGHSGRTFDYCSPTHPSVSSEEDRRRGACEHEKLGFRGRFGAGLPRINDGSFLFLQHMISKMKPVERAEVASPSYSTARHCSPERLVWRVRDPRWIIENDWLDAVSRCPTSSSTTRASRPTSDCLEPEDTCTSWQGAADRCSRVVRQDAQVACEKRKQISDEQIAEITRLYDDFAEGARVKILPNERSLHAHHVERPSSRPGGCPRALASVEKSRA